MRIVGKAAQIYHNMSLRVRLIVTFFALALVLITFVSLYATMRMARSTEAEVMQSTRQILSGVENYLGYRLDEADRIAGIIVTNPDVQTILNAGNVNIPLGKQISDYKQVSALLTRYQYNYNIYRLCLYIREGLIYSNENVNILSLKKIDGAPWYRELADHNVQVMYGSERAYYVWNNPKDIVFCARPIFSMSDLNEVIGIVRVDILRSDIDKMLATTAIPEQQGTVVLMTADGAVISQAGAGGYDDGSARVLSGLAQGQRWVDVGGKRNFVDVQLVPDTDWRICYIVPADRMFRSIRVLRSEMLVVLTAAIILALLATIFSVSRNMHQIGELITRMKLVRSGDFSVRSPVSGNNEIGQLELNFNYLVQSVSSLMDEVVRKQRDIKNTEIRLLQSQIQPHFLYNTLDLINWRVMRQRDEVTSRIIRNLSDFYKIGLSHGSEFVTVSKELEHMKLYLDIQNDRFDHTISCEVRVEAEILNCVIPKVILQPLVENSILHGFYDKEANDERHIWINAFTDEGKLRIDVADDGSGMSEEAMRDILNEDYSRHYGVWNIQQRILLMFGGEYGLAYVANPPRGTRVRITLPIQYGRDPGELRVGGVR